MTSEESAARIARLEAAVRVLGVVAAALAIVAISAITFSSATAQSQPQLLRARGLIIVDDQGGADRNRIASARSKGGEAAQPIYGNGHQ